MLDKIEMWIEKTLENNSNNIESCERFLPDFKGFYSADFLSNSYFVVTDKPPKPDFPELRQMGLGNFIDVNHDGITYKNTYFVKPQYKNDFNLHFHELVHVAQWQILGVKGFINRYIDEMRTHDEDYSEAPLEIMAYTLTRYFSNGGEPLDIFNHVQQNI